MMLLIVGILGVALDQWTKSWIMAHMTLNQSREIFGNGIRLTYTQNTGVAFSLLADLPAGWKEPLLITIAIAVIGAIVISMKKIASFGAHYETAYGLVLSGAVGNLIDRIQFGAVIDFVDIGVGVNRWPVFNVADSAICVGALLLMFSSFFKFSK